MVNPEPPEGKEKQANRSCSHVLGISVSVNSHDDMHAPIPHGLILISAIIA